MCPIDYHHFGRRFKQHYACFGCRKTFKNRAEYVPVRVVTPTGTRIDRVPREVPCPDCGTTMARMGRLFRAPKRTKVREWALLAALYGGPGRHLGAPFDEPRRREARRRREADGGQGG